MAQQRNNRRGRDDQQKPEEKEIWELGQPFVVWPKTQDPILMEEEKEDRESE